MDGMDDGVDLTFRGQLGPQLEGKLVQPGVECAGVGPGRRERCGVLAGGELVPARGVLVFRVPGIAQDFNDPPEAVRTA
ncbi:hypothetical protein [Arthrobacter sp. SAFR-014]|uniref:hypothetical protein n=1 Tax=unclassified Arthrobacter TaxID=235627 RepID=UPI003F7CD102